MSLLVTENALEINKKKGGAQGTIMNNFEMNPKSILRSARGFHKKSIRRTLVYRRHPVDDGCF